MLASTSGLDRSLIPSTAFSQSALPAAAVHDSQILWSNSAWTQVAPQVSQTIVASDQVTSKHPADGLLCFSVGHDFSFRAAIQTLGGSRTVFILILHSVEDLTAAAGATLVRSPEELASDALNPLSVCSTKSPFEQRLEALGSAAEQTLRYSWADTHLGPLSTWSSALQAAVFSGLASVNPAALYIGVGSETLVLHNQAYGEMTPSLDLFGKGAATINGFDFNWTTILDQHKKCQATGRAFAVKEGPWLLPDKLGRMVTERYFDYEWMPIYDSNGTFLCSFNSSRDVSEKVYAKRSLDAIAAMAQATADCRTVEHFCSAVVEGLSSAEKDVPFILLYTTNDSTNVVPAGITGTKRSICMTLRACHNVPEDHWSAPHLVQLHPPWTSESLPEEASFLLSEEIADVHDLPWDVETVMREHRTVTLEGLETVTQLYGEAARTGRAVVFPINVQNGAIEGFLVLGLNMLRPYEDDYSIWFETVAANIRTGLSKVVAIEHSELQASRVQELERLRSIFFQTIGDELRAQVALIHAPLGDLLEKQDIDRQSRRNIRMASRNSLKLMNLFNTLSQRLDYFRLQAGEWTPIFRLIQLDLLATEVVHQVMSHMRGTAIMITVHCQPVQIFVDPDIFEKLLLLLIGSLLRGLRRSREHAIHVTITANEEGAVLAVTSKTCIAKTSTKFNSMTENVLAKRSLSERSGMQEDLSSFDRLGMARQLLLDFVRMLRGELKETQPDGELRFFVTFPTRNRASLVDERVVEEPERPFAAQPRFAYAAAVVSDESSPSDESEQSTISENPTSRFPEIDALYGDGPVSVRSCTVLIADNNEEMRSFCQDALSSMFNVIEAANAQEALAVVSEKAPDLLICEASLPGLDGFACITALREMGSEMPAIILSNRAGGEARADSLMAGASDFLVKPFSAREVLVKCCSQLQIAKLRADLQARLQTKSSALTESELRVENLGSELTAIASASPVGLFTLDQWGTILYANDQWHKITGIPHNASADLWPDFVDPEDFISTTATFQKSVQDRSACSMAVLWQNSKSTLMALRPYKADAVTQRFVGSLVDMSEVRRLEAEQIQMSDDRAAEAVRMRQLQEISVDIFSHELRNPLSAIMQGAELLSEELERIASEADRCIAEDKISVETHRFLIDKLMISDDTLCAIKSCSTHQRRIADDILNFSKLNMKLLSLDIQPFDIRELIGQTQKMFDAEMRKQGLIIKIVTESSLEEHRGQYVRADAHRLNQVVINFLTNAIRYSKEARSRTIEIILSASSSAPEQRAGHMRVSPKLGHPFTFTFDPVWITVAVQDYGRGLSIAQQHKLFERFSQASPKSDGISGSGLGLFISKEIIHLHGGFVEIESTEHISTTFSFTIPAERSTAAEAVPVESMGAAIRATSLTLRREAGASPDRPVLGRARSSQQNTKMEQRASQIAMAALQMEKRVSQLVDAAARLERTVSRQGQNHADRERLVLVVDDSSINVKLLARQLEKRNFTVITGSNGKEALDLMEKYEGRLMASTLDVNMPVMDGKTAIAERRRREKAKGWPALLVIAVTGNARQAQKDECIAAGYSHVLTKPYSVDDIKDLIEAGAAVYDPVSATKLMSGAKTDAMH